MPRYAFHGRVWETPLDLHLPTTDEPASVSLQRGGSRTVSDDVPVGELLAELVDPAHGRRLYSAARAETGVLLRFHRLCDFEVSPDLTEVRWHLERGQSEDFVPVLAAGTLASVLLMLDGHPVLHGSAVEVDGGALAFVGASGMGKSTLSALLSREGGRLITDDVLRVDLDADGPVCRRGATESRLRAGAAYLSDGAPVRCTADGRTAYAPTAAPDDRVPLRAIAVPYPTRGIENVQVEWLTASSALIELIRFPRVVGWRHGPSLAQHFAFLGRLVLLVHVARLEVPWNDRLDARTAGQIRDVLEAGPQGV